MKSFTSLSRLGIYALVGVAALTLSSALPAQAGTSISIGGDTSRKITAKAVTSADSVRRGVRVSGTSNITYSLNLLGIPLPATGYYMNSFPTTFGQPRLDAYNANLSTTYYRKIYDLWQGATQWVINGSSSFLGSKEVSIKGSSIASLTGSKFFHAGTGSGHNTDANAAVRVTVY